MKKQKKSKYSRQEINKAKKIVGVKFKDQLPQGVLKMWGIETKSEEEALNYIFSLIKN